MKSSTGAAVFIFLVLGGSFGWWFTHRDSYLLVQLNSKRGLENQSATIAQYQRLLKRKNLSKENEIKIRRELGNFYWQASRVDLPVAGMPGPSSKTKGNNPYLDKAKQEFKRILELDANDYVAHANLGRIYLVNNMEKYAMEELELSRQLEPRSSFPLQVLAEVYIARDEPRLARDAALQALALDPHDDSARFALMRAYDGLGDVEKAIREHDLLSADFKADALVRAQFASYLAEQNYWDRAQNEMAQALDNQGSDGRIHFLLGEMLLMRGRNDQAAAEFVLASKFQLGWLVPMFYHAQATARGGECVDARTLANTFGAYGDSEGGTHYARSPYTHMLRGWAALCEGKADEAVVSFRDASFLSSEFMLPVTELAQIYLDRGQFNQLGDLLRPLLDKKQHESIAYSFLAQSFYLQHEYSLARDMAEKSMAINARNPWGYIWMGLSDVAQGRLSDGDRLIQQGAQLNDRDPSLQAYAALAAALGNDFSGANTKIKTVLQNNPEHSPAWFLQGEIFRLQKFHTEAAQAYRRSLAGRPHHLWSQLGLAATCSDSGDQECARQALRGAHLINPTNKDVQKWRKKIL